MRQCWEKHFHDVIFSSFYISQNSTFDFPKNDDLTDLTIPTKSQRSIHKSIMRAGMKTLAARLLALIGLLCAIFSPPLTLAFATKFPSSRAGFGGIGTSTSSKSSSALSSTAPVEEAELADTSPNIADSSKTKIIAEDDEFIKPDLDTRQYRAITLANNLTCLLVSDPLTDVEAGSIHINSGHFQDPAHRPGLAHFHEHMLFLQSKRALKVAEWACLQLKAQLVAALGTDDAITGVITWKRSEETTTSFSSKLAKEHFRNEYLACMTQQPNSVRVNVHEGRKYLP